MEQQASLADLVFALRRRWRMIAIVTFAAMVSAVLAGLWLMPRVYVAEVSLRTPGEEQRLGGLAQYITGLGAGLDLGTAGTRDYRWIVESDELARRVVSRLNLKAFLRESTTPAAARKLREKTTTGERDNVLWIRVRVTGSVRGFSRLPTDVNEGGKAVGADVEVRETAAAIANAFADELVTYLERESVTTQGRTVAFIREEREKALTELTKAREELQQFQQQHQTVALDEEALALVNVASQLERDQRIARATLAELSASLDRAKERQAANGQAKGLQLPATSELLTTLYDEYVRRQTELALMQQELTDRHPEVQALKATLAELDRRIEEEKGRIRQAASAELGPTLVDLAVSKAGAQARANSLSAAVAGIRAQLGPVPEQQRRLAELQLDVQTKQALYERLIQDEKHAEIEERREGTWAQVLDRAIPPMEPVSPRLKLILALAFVVGLMFSITWALVADALAGGRAPKVALGDDDASS